MGLRRPQQRSANLTGFERLSPLTLPHRTEGASGPAAGSTASTAKSRREGARSPNLQPFRHRVHGEVAGLERHPQSRPSRLDAHRQAQLSRENRLARAASILAPRRGPHSLTSTSTPARYRVQLKRLPRLQLDP